MECNCTITIDEEGVTAKMMSNEYIMQAGHLRGRTSIVEDVGGSKSECLIKPLACVSTKLC